MARNKAFAVMVALILALGAATPGRAQDAKARYASMAPVEQYLMDRNAEIAMARSAAPAAISGDAAVLVLGRGGYETAVKGTNGFVCLVERAWMNDFGAPEFWNAKQRGPECLNPPAARSYLKLAVKKTEMALSGLSKAQMKQGLSAAFDEKKLPPLEPGAMAYMMSRDGYLNDDAGHWRPHLMILVPPTDSTVWGAGVPGSPVMLHQDAAERLTVFFIPVGRWSDGTAAPPMESATAER